MWLEDTVRLIGRGEVVVATRDIPAHNPQSLTDLEAPRKPSTYTLRLWLSDAEGNVGAPAQAPLAYECPRSETAGGQGIGAGVGDELALC